jgi:hypothetical protein
MQRDAYREDEDKGEGSASARCPRPSCTTSASVAQIRMMAHTVRASSFPTGRTVVAAAAMVQVLVRSAQLRYFADWSNFSAYRAPSGVSLCLK